MYIEKATEAAKDCAMHFIKDIVRGLSNDHLERDLFAYPCANDYVTTNHLENKVYTLTEGAALLTELDAFRVLAPASLKVEALTDALNEEAKATFNRAIQDVFTDLMRSLENDDHIQSILEYPVVSGADHQLWMDYLAMRVRLFIEDTSHVG